MCAYKLCTTVVHNTAQNSFGYFFLQAPDNHSSDAVYWRGRDVSQWKNLESSSTFCKVTGHNRVTHFSEANHPGFLASPLPAEELCAKQKMWSQHLTESVMVLNAVEFIVIASRRKHSLGSLPTVLAGYRPSVCFCSIIWTDWPLNWSFCICVAHDQLAWD